MTVFEKIKAQQKGKENTLGWCVGETLKAICRADPHCAEIVSQDLENESMSIHACAKKNKENADRIQKEQKTNFVYVSPEEEERIIRAFYGLPGREAEKAEPVAEAPDLFAVDDEFDIFSL